MMLAHTFSGMFKYPFIDLFLPPPNERDNVFASVYLKVNFQITLCSLLLTQRVGTGTIGKLSVSCYRMSSYGCLGNTFDVTILKCQRYFDVEAFMSLYLLLFDLESCIGTGTIRKISVSVIEIEDHSCH